MGADQLDLYARLADIATRPAPFARETTATLWTDPHLSEQMLRFHLDDTIDTASRSTAFIERSVAWLTDTFALGAGRRVIDLGCGPGLYTNRLARTGAEVTGIDLSARSIAHATEVAVQQGSAARHVHGDYLTDRPVSDADLATLIMCDFGALGPDRRRALLTNVRRMLRRDGALVLDVYSPSRFAGVRPQANFGPNLMDGFFSAGPHVAFHSTFTYDEQQLVLDRYDLVEPQRSWSIFDWAQHFDVDGLTRELAGSGLVVEVVYGDVAGAPFTPEGEVFAVVARLSQGPSTVRGRRGAGQRASMEVTDGGDADR